MSWRPQDRRQKQPLVRRVMQNIAVQDQPTKVTMLEFGVPDLGMRTQTWAYPTRDLALARVTAILVRYWTADVREDNENEIVCTVEVVRTDEVSP